MQIYNLYILSKNYENFIKLFIRLYRNKNIAYINITIFPVERMHNNVIFKNKNRVSTWYLIHYVSNWNAGEVKSILLHKKAYILYNEKSLEIFPLNFFIHISPNPFIPKLRNCILIFTEKYCSWKSIYRNGIFAKKMY